MFFFMIMFIEGRVASVPSSDGNLLHLILASVQTIASVAIKLATGVSKVIILVTAAVVNGTD